MQSINSNITAFAVCELQEAARLQQPWLRTAIIIADTWRETRDVHYVREFYAVPSKKMSKIFLPILISPEGMHKFAG